MAVMTIPAPLYPCAFKACATEVSLPADMLYWSNKEAGWYCEICAVEADIETSDWSIEDELEYLVPSAGACCDGGGGGCASPDCWMKRLRRREREVEP